MSGYDNSPDYGGTEIGSIKVKILTIVVLVVGFAALTFASAFAATPSFPASNTKIIEIGCKGCGCRGGPGWRSNKTGRCVGEKQLRKQCGSPPSDNRCTKEY